MLKFLKKEKSIKLSDYFEIVNPKYSILQITPTTGNRNYDTELIAKTIANMYRMPYQRISKELKDKGFKIKFELPSKASFQINITKDDCTFYMIVPRLYSKLFIEKCTEVWKRVNVKEIASIPIKENELNKALKYQLHYEKEDPLSLRVNKKTNDPLNNILNVMEIMDHDDKVDILYNFIPINQSRWKGVYKETMKKIKVGLPIDKEKFNPGVILKYLGIGTIKAIDFVFDVLNDVVSDEKINNNSEAAITMIDKISSLSAITRKKENSVVLNTQLVVTSQSKDKIRQQNNAYAVLESYKNLAQDNSLRYKKINNKDLQIKEVNGQRVITFKDIDMLHERVEGTAGRNFRENKEHFIEGTDFYHLIGKELKYFKQTTDFVGSNAKEVVLITESGYLMLVKSLTDHLAWKVQRALINSYFKVKEINPYAGLSKELKAVFVLDKKTQQIEEKVNNLEKNMPLFNVECKEIQSLVRKVGIKSLGGYRSPAYKDNSLRGKVYADIQHQLKREFGVNRYEAIKRKQLESAKRILEGYTVPLILEMEITALNNQTVMEEVACTK